MTGDSDVWRDDVVALRWEGNRSCGGEDGGESGGGVKEER